jgi:hypothetical protein
MSKTSRKLVIDASVAGAAGRAAGGAPPGAACRQFLLAVLDICHHFVMTPQLRDEWEKHESGFSRTWRSGMAGRRKMFFLEDAVAESLRRQVSSLDLPDRQVSAMLKDIHLVGAALRTDGLIVSIDDEARQLYEDNAALLPDVHGVRWVSPVRNIDAAVTWLAAGAKPEALEGPRI